MVWKELLKRYPYSTFQPKKISLSLICSDLSLTPKKVPFSENSRTCMVTQLVKVFPPGLLAIIHRFLTPKWTSQLVTSPYLATLCIGKYSAT